MFTSKLITLIDQIALWQGQQTFSMKKQAVNILGFVG